jgi:hypothetical protein
MAIQSMDQLITSLSGGKSVRYDGNKITGAAGYTAGRWYDMSGLNGLPVANAFAGTALAWRACDETTGNGTQIFGIPHGGNVAADIKHALNLNAWGTAATAVPATLMLVDMEGYYPGINMNVATLQTLTGTPAPRSTNGAGLRAMLVVTATTGATAHNLSMSYTDQGGTAGNTLPVTVACTASAIVPHITHSGVAANNYGPFLPLASGDSGIRSVQTVQLSAASLAGTAALVLCKPITQITISVSGLMTEKDLLNQIPSLPRIPDGACLTWILGAGAAVAASTTFNFGTEYVWG